MLVESIVLFGVCRPLPLSQQNPDERCLHDDDEKRDLPALPDCRSSRKSSYRWQRRALSSRPTMMMLAAVLLLLLLQLPSIRMKQRVHCDDNQLKKSPIIMQGRPTGSCLTDDPLSSRWDDSWRSMSHCGVVLLVEAVAHSHSSTFTMSSSYTSDTTLTASDVTATIFYSNSDSDEDTATFSETVTLTKDLSVTDSDTISGSVTVSETLFLSSSTETLTVDDSASVTTSNQRSETFTAPRTPTKNTVTLTEPRTNTRTAVLSPTVTASLTLTGAVTYTQSDTTTYTYTESVNISSLTETFSNERSHSRSTTGSDEVTATRSAVTNSPSFTRTYSSTKEETMSGTMYRNRQQRATRSSTMTVTVTETASEALTRTLTLSKSDTHSSTVTGDVTMSVETFTMTNNVTLTLESETLTATASSTKSPSRFRRRPNRRTATLEETLTLSLTSSSSVTADLTVSGDTMSDRLSRSDSVTISQSMTFDVTMTLATMSDVVTWSRSASPSGDVQTASVTTTNAVSKTFTQTLSKGTETSARRTHELSATVSDDMSATPESPSLTFSVSRPGPTLTSQLTRTRSIPTPSYSITVAWSETRSSTLTITTSRDVDPAGALHRGNESYSASNAFTQSATMSLSTVPSASKTLSNAQSRTLGSPTFSANLSITGNASTRSRTVTVSDSLSPSDASRSLRPSHTVTEDLTQTNTMTIGSVTSTRSHPLPPPAPQSNLQSAAGMLLFPIRLSDSDTPCLSLALLIVVPLLALCFLEMVLLWCARCIPWAVTVDTYLSVPLWRSLFAATTYWSVIVPCHFRCAYLHTLRAILHLLILLVVLEAVFWGIVPVTFSMYALSLLIAVIAAQSMKPLFHWLTWYYRYPEDDELDYKTQLAQMRRNAALKAQQAREEEKRRQFEKLLDDATSSSSSDSSSSPDMTKEGGGSGGDVNFDYSTEDVVPFQGRQEQRHYAQHQLRHIAPGSQPYHHDYDTTAAMFHHQEDDGYQHQQQQQFYDDLHVDVEFPEEQLFFPPMPHEEDSAMHPSRPTTTDGSLARLPPPSSGLLDLAFPGEESSSNGGRQLVHVIEVGSQRSGGGGPPPQRRGTAVSISNVAWGLSNSASMGSAGAGRVDEDAVGPTAVPPEESNNNNNNTSQDNLSFGVFQSSMSDSERSNNNANSTSLPPVLEPLPPPADFDASPVNRRPSWWKPSAAPRVGGLIGGARKSKKESSNVVVVFDQNDAASSAAYSPPISARSSQSEAATTTTTASRGPTGTKTKTSRHHRRPKSPEFNFESPVRERTKGKSNRKRVAPGPQGIVTIPDFDDDLGIDETAVREQRAREQRAVQLAALQEQRSSVVSRVLAVAGIRRTSDAQHLEQYHRRSSSMVSLTSSRGEDGGDTQTANEDYNTNNNMTTAVMVGLTPEQEAALRRRQAQDHSLPDMILPVGTEAEIEEDREDQLYYDDNFQEKTIISRFRLEGASLITYHLPTTIFLLLVIGVLLFAVDRFRFLCATNDDFRILFLIAWALDATVGDALFLSFLALYRYFSSGGVEGDKMLSELHAYAGERRTRMYTHMSQKAMSSLADRLAWQDRRTAEAMESMLRRSMEQQQQQQRGSRDTPAPLPPTPQAAPPAAVYSPSAWWDHEVTKDY